jgi:hypothetical protein
VPFSYISRVVSRDFTLWGLPTNVFTHPSFTPLHAICYVSVISFCLQGDPKDLVSGAISPNTYVAYAIEFISNSGCVGLSSWIIVANEVKCTRMRSSGRRSWLQIQRSVFDSRRYQTFWEVVGLERGPFSLMSTIEKLLGRKSSGSVLEIREYGRRDPSRWPRCTLYPQTLALTSPTSGSRLQIQMSGFDSLRYKIFWEVVGLERAPLSLVSTVEELLGRNSSGSGLENRDYDRRRSAALSPGQSSIRKVGTNFVDNRRSLGRYSSLVD